MGFSLHPPLSTTPHPSSLLREPEEKKTAALPPEDKQAGAMPKPAELEKVPETASKPVFQTEVQAPQTVSRAPAAEGAEHGKPSERQLQEEKKDTAAPQTTESKVEGKSEPAAGAEMVEQLKPWRVEATVLKIEARNGITYKEKFVATPRLVKLQLDVTQPKPGSANFYVPASTMPCLVEGKRYSDQ
jgi:hypothetical protein